MMWFETAISAASALLGGFIGGWVVAFRLGRWRQRIEDHLEGIEARLSRGDNTIGSVPILETRVELILEELRAMKDELRRDRRNFVTHEECNRRHAATP
ncbi:MAG: hypothetical protein J7M08_08565 [Planctomycetes bacterium]|nr:hypothetical protein [Planctomycetota bacterium]